MHRLAQLRRLLGAMSLLATCVMMVAAGWSASNAAGSQTGPLFAGLPDFENTHVATVPRATDLAFLPDGDLLITSQYGQLLLYSDGVLVEQPLLDLESVICSNRERGLLGVAVDPTFAENGYIYLYYSHRHGEVCTDATTRVTNRVVRYVLSDDDTLEPTSASVIVDNIDSTTGIHNAGDLDFGADGLLYISVGDGGEPARAPDLARLEGKMLRVHRDGSIPGTNPYADASGARRCGDPAGRPEGTGPCMEVIASGLRNPFRFTFRPASNQFYINDVGEHHWEEVNAGLVGADYGWPFREGACRVGSASDCPEPLTQHTDPLLSYLHQEQGCSSITGSAFVPAGIWPLEYDNAYLFADFICGMIFRMEPTTAGTWRSEPFVTGLGRTRIVSMVFGPHGDTQALFYTSYPNGGVKRIAFTGDPGPRFRALLPQIVRSADQGMLPARPITNFR